MKLWVDDLRSAPEGWVHAKSVNAALEYILANLDALEVISLDHDAGDFAKYGGDYIKILDFLEAGVASGNRVLEFKFHLHSQNPVGVQNMRAIIQHNGWQEVMSI